MNQAIIYKEWIKTHLYISLTAVVWLGFTAYAILSIERMLTYSGAVYVWLSVLEQNNVLIEAMKYLPPLIALGLGLVQFIPEMQQNRLKLTLHLPMNQTEMILKMLVYGGVVLAVFYAVQIVTLWIYLDSVIASELVAVIFSTASLWYIAGWMIYLLSAWIAIEPTWQRRVFNALIAAGLMRVMYFNAYPCSYSTMMVWIIVWCILLLLFPVYSADRFRRGCQD